MINELIPAVGYYQAMILSGYTDYQIQQLTQGYTHE